MAGTDEQIKGIPLTAKPEGIKRCGMSATHFAQHCQTQQWYQISKLGKIIGAPAELDYYRREEQPVAGGTTNTQKRELTGV